MNAVSELASQRVRQIKAKVGSDKVSFIVATEVMGATPEPRREFQKRSVFEGFWKSYLPTVLTRWA